MKGLISDSRPKKCVDEGRARAPRARVCARAIVVINHIKNWMKSNTAHGRIQKENYVKLPFSKILNFM